jgi:type IX secretion system PorP/SprF family membrane protein
MKQGLNDRIKYTCSCTILFCIFWGSIFAQQLPVHSGNTNNPFLYNPAIAGSKPYIDFRLQHKNQWLGMDGAPSTQVFSAHSSVDKKKYGLGGVVYNDKAGVLGNTGISLSYSYHIKLTEKLNLSIGLSGSIAQHRINRNKVILAHDTDNLIDIESTANKVAPNAAGGLHLYDDGNFYVGISAVNLIPTKINYQNDAVIPQVGHYYIMAAKTFYVGESISLQPTGLINYIGNNPLMVDLRLKVDYNELFQIEAGYRIKDGLIAGFGIYPHPDFGVSYNYNLSMTSMRTGNYGSHEIMLNYIFYYKPAYKMVRRRYKWIDRNNKSDGSNGSVPQLN